MVSLLGLLMILLSGCVEADLGEAPVFCNEGRPRCPNGYVCHKYNNGTEHCLKEGSDRLGQANPGVTRADAGATYTD